MDANEPAVLFLCTGNSIRSQMSEVYLKALGEGKIKAYSAGVSPSFVHPLTLKVLQEEGLDTADLISKSVWDTPLAKITTLITLCDHAFCNMPADLDVIPQKIHWPIDDPISMPGSDEQRLKNFRRTRDVIRGKIITFLKERS